VEVSFVDCEGLGAIISEWKVKVFIRFRSLAGVSGALRWFEPCRNGNGRLGRGRVHTV
jgi:hypothetical protein